MYVGLQYKIASQYVSMYVGVCTYLHIISMKTAIAEGNKTERALI